MMGGEDEDERKRVVVITRTRLAGFASPGVQSGKYSLRAIRGIRGAIVSIHPVPT